MKCHNCNLENSIDCQAFSIGSIKCARCETPMPKEQADLWLRRTNAVIFPVYDASSIESS